MIDLSLGVLHLLQSLLKWDEEKRLTIREVLDHYYFRDQPKMCAPSELPSYPELRYKTSEVEEDETEKQRALKRKRDMETDDMELNGPSIGPCMQ